MEARGRNSEPRSSMIAAVLGRARAQAIRAAMKAKRASSAPTPAAVAAVPLMRPAPLRMMSKTRMDVSSV